MLVVKLQKLQKAPPNCLKIEIITRPKREHVTDKIQRQETFTISAVALKQTRGKDQLLLAKRKRTNPNFFKKIFVLQMFGWFSSISKRLPRTVPEKISTKSYPENSHAFFICIFTIKTNLRGNMKADAVKYTSWSKSRYLFSNKYCWFINNLCHNFLNVLSNAWSYISRDVCSQ